jgi:hypothetical protein
MKHLLLSVLAAFCATTLSAQKLMKVKAEPASYVVKEYPGLTLRELKEYHKVENKVDEVMKISESPVQGSFSVTFASQEAGKAAITLMDNTGKTLYGKIHVITAGTNELTVPDQNLAPGVYVLRLSTETVEARRRIIAY